MRQKNTPYFLWDYDLSEQEVKRNIKEGDEFTRSFLVSRILESAKYEDIWQYIRLSDLVRIFPQLKLKNQIRKAWQKAFRAWGISF